MTQVQGTTQYPPLSDYNIQMIHNSLLRPNEHAVEAMRQELDAAGCPVPETPVKMAREIRRLRGVPDPDSY